MKKYVWAMALLFATNLDAQIGTWKIGGSGLSWSENDSITVLIEVGDHLRPIYFSPNQNAYEHFSGWEPLRIPRELSFVFGEVPRAWKGAHGNETTAHNGTYLVDGDSTTFNPPVSSQPETVWYTLDTGVPVPAIRFGFFTPPRGYRSDGTPFVQDAVPAFEVSISAEGEAEWLEKTNYQQVGNLIALQPENFSTNVQIEFPKQYVRFVRYKRLTSLLDSGMGTSNSTGAGVAFAGTIADFEIFAEGVPRRAVYRSRIFDLGKGINLGRIHWSAAPMRMINGQLVEVDSENVKVSVEVRSGRDGDPNVYHEHTDRGGEEEVSRERYERVLQPLLRSGVVREPRPGMRASIDYDTENWSFWTSSFEDSGGNLGLRGGSYLQLRVTLHSEEFDTLIRLDSLWIDTSPLLADQVIAEVARRDQPNPASGFTQVELGQPTEFVYDVQAHFVRSDEIGFDALKISTGSPVEFRGLELGEPPIPVEPLLVKEGEDELVVYLPQRIETENNLPLRIFFASQVFALAWTFAGEVMDIQTTSLPQPVVPGDAGNHIGTSQLRVLGSTEHNGRTLHQIDFSSDMITPNDDGINDVLTIEYTLFQLMEHVPVVLEIYALDGRLMTRRELGLQRFGPQRTTWDGRDDKGYLLAPGMYIVGITLMTGTPLERPLRPIGVAY
ncbi:MAG: hypothetical protein VX294_02240 [Candidatus Latescibacterota bacterium]|nr:hypothetical protein [Candidatus Latescibacterota bacterium]